MLTIFCLFTTNVFSADAPTMQSAPTVDFTAVGGPAKTVSIGSLDPNTGFKFLLELTSKGAAIKRATLSEFDDRNPENPQPLVLLSPVTRPDGSQSFSMANEAFVLGNYQLQLRLDKLNWDILDVTKESDGSQLATFEAIIKDKIADSPAIKLTKTYRVSPGIYHIECNLTVENLLSDEQKIQFDLSGPVGIEREDTRTDSRKAVAGFRDIKDQIVSSRLNIRKLRKAVTDEQRALTHRGAGFLWAAITNKYFAAIVVPEPGSDTDFCNWIIDKLGWFAETAGGEGNIGIDLRTTTITLAEENSRTFNFELFIGPKDKDLFDKNPMYKNLGFVQTIDFLACCCPAAIIQPLAFGILWLMKWLHGFWPHNYGIVIIILVLVVRLILHPLTKKGQVSMSEYSKFQSLPEVQEIRKKYSKDLMEMNRRIAEVQKKHGVSHSTMLMGMLPTLVQMPIWIALYSAIYASVDLRGAGFLPVWITDLSAPDALFKFPGGYSLPLFGDSFNLLPILMGVAFFLQQKLMPSQQAAPTPEAAQQQKIMMFMLPVVFPLMLYKSPSGLNLYIMASVFGGVFEQYIIKKHIREKEQQKAQGLVAVTSKTGGKIKKKKPKPFFKI